MIGWNKLSLRVDFRPIIASWPQTSIFRFFNRFNTKYFRGKKSGIKTGILGICLKNPTRKGIRGFISDFWPHFRSQGQNILKFYKNPTANIGSNCEETFDFLKFLYFLPLWRIARECPLLRSDLKDKNTPHFQPLKPWFSIFSPLSTGPVKFTSFPQ